MIPADWMEYRREDDDELLGFIEGIGDSFQARTIFGYPVGTPRQQDDAERSLDTIGLSYLAERWLLSLDGRDEPIAVQLVEATPHTLTVKSVDYGYEGDYGSPFALSIPVATSVLRPERSL